MGSNNKIRCVICGGEELEDFPCIFKGRNPKTFRVAWMHDLCAIEALEALRGKSTNDPRYEDQHDRYLQSDV